jgi:hypothetical protein
MVSKKPKTEMVKLLKTIIEPSWKREAQAKKEKKDNDVHIALLDELYQEANINFLALDSQILDNSKKLKGLLLLICPAWLIVITVVAALYLLLPLIILSLLIIPGVAYLAVLLDRKTEFINYSGQYNSLIHKMKDYKSLNEISTENFNKISKEFRLLKNKNFIPEVYKEKAKLQLQASNISVDDILSYEAKAPKIRIEEFEDFESRQEYEERHSINHRL